MAQVKNERNRDVWQTLTKAGACGSLRNLVQDPRLNHRVEVISGVLADETSDLMKSFFHTLRETKKLQKENEGNQD